MCVMIMKKNKSKLYKNYKKLFENNFIFIFFRLYALLTDIFSQPDNKTIIFVETKRSVDNIVKLVNRNG